MLNDCSYLYRTDGMLETSPPVLTNDADEAHRMADDKIDTIILSYKYRLLPTKAQHAALNDILEQQRILYNAALEERIDCYRKTGLSRTYIDQCMAITEWRQSDEEARSTPVNLQRWTLKRLDEAYKGFFDRLKRGDKAGFPRFRGNGWWKSFGFNELLGLRFDGKRIRFKSLPGSLRVHLHRPPPPDADLRSCTFTKDAKGWHVVFQLKTAAQPRNSANRHIGIDVGLTSLATLSDGTSIPNPRCAKRAEKELRRRQRALSRCKKGSNRRKKVRAGVARLHRKVKNTRETHLHQLSADLISKYDLIAVEKLNMKGMTKSRLAKSVHDASWGKFRQMLAYKAAKAGCELVEVDPRNTSQACSGCGVIVPKELHVRTHDCPDCGLVLDRDHNAAINILHKAVAGLGLHNVVGYGERATGNIICEEIAA